MKCKHFSAVLVYFAKAFGEISVEKYKEFKEVNFYSMRARTKVLARDVTKTGMGNGEWGMGMGKGEWGRGNGEWGMGNGGQQ